MNGERRTFADNQRGNTVADAIRAFAVYGGHRWPIAIASGYFDLGGFSAIADALEAAPGVRIVLGVEPRPPRETRSHASVRATEEEVRRGVTGLQGALVVERDLLPFDAATAREIERLRDFLSRPTTEVRLFRERFLHGKAFVFGHEAGVIAGSANFTGAGLCRNLELDLGQYEPDRVEKVRRWFEELWEAAEPYDLAAVFAARTATFDPYTIYLRMLFELYGDEPELRGEELAPQPGPAALRLAAFQRLGVLRAERILRRFGGVLIADGVGLGKTFIAGELLRRAISDEAVRVLLLSPASLRDSVWDGFLKKHQLGVESLSYQELATDSEVGEPPRNGEPDRRRPQLAAAANQYRVIVVDEAHAFRNPDTQHYRSLRRLVAAGGTPKRLVLLTATPVNNSLWDLYYQVLLFARHEAAFADVGIPNLRDRFAAALSADLEQLSPAVLFPILDAVSVRRTRRHIQHYYADDRLGDPPRPVSFPRVRLRSLRYALGSVLPGFFDEVADAIEHRLTLAAYVPDAYRLEAVSTGRQEVLAGLLRSQLLKRFESSLGAFRRTLERLVGTHDRFLDMLGRGLVLVREADPDELADELGDDVLAAMSDGRSVAVDGALYDRARLRAAVEADRHVLDILLVRANEVRPQEDPKLRALAELIRQLDRERGDARKLIVFSYYADTIAYIREYIGALPQGQLGGYAGRYAQVTGAESPEQRRNLVWDFVPRSSGALPGHAERLDLLFATDALAEGQNLQQAGRLVNFDLPWNPMRIVQRNGRLDRLWSEHEEVLLYSFFPEYELDALLGLEERLRHKIAQANAAVGLESPPLPGLTATERTFADVEESIRAIANEDERVIDEEEERIDAFSGETFREDLRRALLAGRGPELRTLPWGAGSGLRKSRPDGGLFAARVGDERIWRFVPLTDDELRSDLLGLLELARCEDGAPRHLPAKLENRLYELWARARAEIHEEYMAKLDPLTRQASVPKAQRDAVTLLQSVALPETGNAIVALQIPWPLAIGRTIRRLLRALERPDVNPESVAREIIDLVRDEGLRPPRPSDAPIPVELDEVRLVCFQAVSA